MLKYIEKICLRSWGVIVFILLCFILFEHAVKKLNQDYSKLSLNLEELQIAKDQALNEQEELLLRINSESDPSWIELTLMQGLGVVPENQTKVYFTNSK